MVKFVKRNGNYECYFGDNEIVGEYEKLIEKEVSDEELDFLINGKIEEVKKFIYYILSNETT